MSASEPAEQTGEPGYEWAVGSEPDTVYVQLPPVGAAGGTGAHDALRTLFRRRGFGTVEGDDLALAGVANGCALVRTDDAAAHLVVSISERVGATRIPVPHGDAAWSARVFRGGQVLVVLTEAAVVDGAVTHESLDRDRRAGGVTAAIVPAGEL